MATLTELIDWYAPHTSDELMGMLDYLALKDFSYALSAHYGAELTAAEQAGHDETLDSIGVIGYIIADRVSYARGEQF